MFKSLKTKAINKLIKEKMEKIKLLFADEQIHIIEEFQKKYNISSEKFKSQKEYLKEKKEIKKEKKKKNLTELSDQQGKGKINTIEKDFKNLSLSSNNSLIHNPLENISSNLTSKLTDYLLYKNKTQDGLSYNTNL